MQQYEKTAGGVLQTPVQGLLPIGMETEGDVRLYKIVFPFVPPSKNETDRWPPEWRSSAKRKWEKYLREQCVALGVPPARKVGLSAIVIFPSKARRDPQNYAQTLWHWIPDGLVKAGVLEDDREGMIEFGPNLGVRFAYDQRVAPKEKRKRTLLALTVHVR